MADFGEIQPASPLYQKENILLGVNYTAALNVRREVSIAALATKL